MTRAKLSRPPDGSSGSKRLADVERYLLSELTSSNAAPRTNGAARRRTATLLSLLGDPQNEVRTVHVAGTAGKGSVCAFLTAILGAHGFRVGTYTSPHVHSLLERFQLDGRPAPVPHLAAALDTVRARERLVSQGDLGAVGMFEAATAAAFQLFHDRNVDYAVVETGIGGAQDATNTVDRPDKLAVLTAIGLDHTAVLGETLPEIARQKAGILPATGAAVAVRCGAEIDETVAAEAAARGCRLDQADPGELAASLPAGLRLRVPGAHQRVNAGLALRAARHLAGRDGWRFDPEQALDGLARACLPGRFERRRWQGHDVILDGAHNPMKLAALAETVRDSWPGRAPVWVLAAKPGKDLTTAMEVVASSASAVVATEFDTHGPNRARGVPLDAEVIAAAARRAGARGVAEPRLPRALAWAVELSDDDLPLIVTGSFYTVADAGRLTTGQEAR